MKSRYLINLLLVMLVIGLFWLNSQPNSDKVASYPSLTKIASDAITTITITRPNNQPIVLNKQENGWQLIEPLSAKANDTRIQLILSLLSTPSFAQLMPSTKDDLTRFGMTASATTLALNEQVFQFGSNETLSKHRYVLYNDTIHLIDDQITPLLNANAASFIENRLLAPNKVIKQLSLPILQSDKQLSANTMTINQVDGHWQAEQLTLSTDALTAIVESWQHAYATQVFPITDDEQALNTAIHVEIRFEDSPSALHLAIITNENSISLINNAAKLKYQFPLSMLTQLFPQTTTTE